MTAFVAVTSTASLLSHISNKDSIAAPFWPLLSTQPLYCPVSYCLFLSCLDRNNDQKKSTDKTIGYLHYRGLFQSLDN